MTCACCSANNNALKGKRKTIALNDVYTALEDMEFDDFIEPLKAQMTGAYVAHAEWLLLCEFLEKITRKNFNS